MRTLLSILALFSVMTLLAQGKNETKEYYLTKSKNQKTVGYVLAGVGGALIVSGIIVGNGDNNNDPNELDFGPNFDVGLWLVGGGIASGLASIPFFISSGNNARKAATIGINHQKIKLPQLNGQETVFQPAISLKIRL
ncbi:MAG TPA: hypothetical protein VFP97_02275 [Chitinophagaceae bacterium]|nr:hypothetical protein [Chitinophagaceae bacterium]